MPGGQPTKYRKEFLNDISVVAEYASEGLTNAVIAKICKVHPDSVQNWRKTNPEFFVTINESKEFFDSNVEQALYQRAVGYKCKETKVFCSGGEIVEKEIVKEYPPDTASCAFWLKNRRSKLWRDVQHQENVHKIERDEIDDLDLARKLVYLLQQGEKQLETHH